MIIRSAASADLSAWVVIVDMVISSVVTIASDLIFMIVARNWERGRPRPHSSLAQKLCVD